MSKYIFIGDGPIPGLPREVSEEYLETLTREEREIFDEALSMGLYVEIQTVRAAGPDEGEQP